MKNIKNILFTLIVVVCSVFILATHKPANNEPPVVTIWVHGTKPQIPDAFYKIGHYFFLPGLHHVDEQCDRYGPRGIIKGLKDSDYVDPKHLYFFGWSGKLNAQKRLEAAKILKENIEKLVQKYIEKYGVAPKLRIITHSHGGNVALNLAHELEDTQSDVVIDEMILLAPPVQSWTKEYVKSKNIGNIYNIYSEGDLIQTADLQGLQVHFNKDDVTDKPKLFEQSKRTFDHHENLTQIQTEINGKNPWHITFMDYYPPLPVFKDLPNRFPHQFPRFLPELGDIMHKVKDADVQAHIKQHQKPIKVKIDTHKTRDENRVTVYL